MDFHRCTLPTCVDQWHQLVADGDCDLPLVVTSSSTQLSHFGARSFNIAGPKAWNHLLADVSASDSVNSCKRALKTFFVPLTITIDQTRRALVIDFPCYGTLEIVSVIIIFIINYPRTC